MTEPLEEPLSPQPLDIETDPRRGRYPEELLMYTAEDLAEIMKITRSTAYKLLKSGNWPHYRIGGAVRFDVADIKAIKDLTRQTPPEPETRKRGQSRLGPRSRLS